MQKNSLSLTGKVVGANIVSMILYCIISMGSYESIGGGAILGGVIAAYHAFGLFITAMALFIIKKNEWAKSLLLASLVIMTIGFSICVGSLSMIPH